MKVDIEYKEIFNKKNIIRHILYFSLTMIFVYGVIYYTMVSFTQGVYKRMEKRIDQSDLSIIDVCYILGCSSLTHKENGLVQIFKLDENGSLYKYKSIVESNYESKSKDSLDYLLFKPLKITMTFSTSQIELDDSVYNGILFNIFVFITILTFIPSLGLYIYIITRISIKQRLNKGLYKSELESTLQRDLTEVLHHELGVPISVINTNVDELMYRMYSCKVNVNETCELTNSNHDYDDLPTKCQYCIKNGKVSEYDLENITLFKDLKLAIDRINSILKIISNSKKIRFSNGTVPIYAICENIISSINSFKLRKIKASYVNIDILKNYSVIAELGNGNLLNILHVLINNSVEAGATEILIEPYLDSHDVMWLYISDNGGGIRDAKGRCILDNNIFKFGYTTKDDDCSRYDKSSLFIKILDILGFTIRSEKPKRGIGLYISRSILQKIGGDIKLMSTSENGTKFKLIIPIKETKKI